MLTKILKFKNFVGPAVWRFLLISVVLGLFWFGIECSFIFVLQGFLFSIGLLDKNQSFLPDWYPTSLVTSVIILMSFGTIRACIFMLRTHFANLAQLSFTCLQREKILTYGLKNAHAVSTSEVVSLFTETTSQSGIFMNYVSMIASPIVSAAFFFLAGLKLAPLEMIIGVAALAIFLLPLKYTNSKINAYGSGLMKEWELVSESLLRGLKNSFFLAIYRQTTTEINRGTSALNNYKTHYMNYSLIGSFSSTFPMFLGILILSIITFLSVRYIHTEPIKLISFFYVFIRLAQAASDASGTLSNMKFSMPGFTTLFRWNQVFEESNRISTKPSFRFEDRAIEIKAIDLTFGFDAKRKLFKNLNFVLRPSNVLLIKGESGVGKSTLLALIFGLQTPTSGEVRINNQSSKDWSFDLHKILAYVGPEPYLINGTIRDNLTYGMVHTEKVKDCDIWDVLEATELTELVNGLAMKLDEPINDIPQISTGQKQRLAFARALLRKPALLILDEATANLDSQTEKKIIKNLKGYIGESICIIVTHKNSFDGLATYNLNLSRSSKGVT